VQIQRSHKQGRTIKKFYPHPRAHRSFRVSLLPLFPLDLVLFPGASLPLHVFEPRYREMISECLDQKKSFGVVRAKEEGVAEIGCTAEIITVTRKYLDGRMDIATEGRERFEVMQVNQERSFLQAEVLYLQDAPDQATPEEIAQAMKLQGEILALAGSSSASPSEIESAQLSFNLVGPMPLDLDFKQTLLGLKSEAERVQAIISYFEAILPNFRRTVRVRQTAGGNGHVH
jgi:Lon protease-like protein